jgi:two-component system, OmpR family, sensor histidine kinase KdpD
MSEARTPSRLVGRRPSGWVGAAVSVLSVAAATAAIYPLKDLAPTVSLSVVYLPAVLLVSAYWGLALGLATSLLSAAAFNFFHLPPTGRFTIADSRNWVALGAFISVAVVVSTVAELARSRAIESERRRAQADLAAALARDLLAESQTKDGLAAAARHVAEALAIPSASIVLGASASAGDRRRRALPLSDADHNQIATLIVPSGLPDDTEEQVETHVVPALEAIVAIALRRDAVQAAAVETEALRRSDDVKTALLRAVSHDLRTPLTAIVAAGHALATPSLTPEEQTELSHAVIAEGERLAALVEKLLDLSQLQAGRAEPRRDWISLEDVLFDASEGVRAAGGEIRVAIEPQLPDVRADAAQLERAFANLLENAERYSRGHPVSVSARSTDTRVLVRIVDQGPGIDPAERERIFEPFYRGAPGQDHWPGSGLGLAIAKGFVEANGGTISVESLPGQGTTFVVALPLERPLVKVNA